MPIPSVLLILMQGRAANNEVRDEMYFQLGLEQGLNPGPEVAFDASLED